MLLAAACPAKVQSFDWGAYPGNASLPAGNYITPVRDQGSGGTCWAFSAVGAVEANYDITYHLTNSTLDLSEQHLVCDGSAGDAVYGGWEDRAFNFTATTASSMKRRSRIRPQTIRPIGRCTRPTRSIGSRPRPI